MARIELDLAHAYKPNPQRDEDYALLPLKMTFDDGGAYALLGPSGCGKTTTLRMVAGLEDPTGGSILVGDRDVTHLPPYQRPVNTVFQSYALFPHLDIFENVAFGLRRRGVKDVKKPVEDMLELVELTSMARRKPAQLSGGQQQRVAVARALINQPDVLLLDEPLGALDLKLRRQMQIELKRIQTEVGITFVHVTHDQEEAMTMADTVAVMNHGRIEQMGSPVDIYESPRTAFVANFLGQSNLFPGDVVSREGDVVVVKAHELHFRIAASRVATEGSSVIVGVRPEKVTIRRSGAHVADGLNTVTGIVTDASFTGMSTQYLVRTAWGQELQVFAQNLSAEEPIRLGDDVVLTWETAHSFGLDGSEDLTAGVDKELLALGTLSVDESVQVGG